ncbi:MAG TPA: chromosome segregation protein SMC [Candidatus Thermoplasmatota archaeon]|nr:chromosome segregation protein SMC [Candidatus Thermoplasmatota archaeon]
MEMENFKSFGQKLSIPFLDGFTAITGPNGSGKSNIGDAVLFVLGPKSNKAIRAGKLTDLIFNGGKEKKPADRCQVSLVFDNVDRVIPVDADEVQLTRLVKLSKSDRDNYYSYFYVNGKPSSLTEFDELLSKARISAEGYNIVRQGDILRICDLPPMQRRTIIDEIAGITRFDSDIEKANKERAEVEANLERIRIILTEIEAQLRTLERERDQAMKFKTIKDDLDITKAKYASRRLTAAQADLANVHQLVSSETAERATLDTELNHILAKIADSDVRLQRIDHKIIERAGPEAKELKGKIEEIKRVAIQAGERLGYAQTQIEEAKADKANFASDLKRQDKEIAKYAKEAKGAKESLEKASADLAEREEKLQRLRDRISAASGKASDVQRDLAQLKLDHDKAQADLHEVRLASERATEKRARLLAAIAEHEESQETQRFELKALETDLRQLDEERSEDPEGLRKEHFALKKKESTLATQLRELEPAVQRMQREYSTLKAQQDANEQVSRGFSNAVNAILSARDQGHLKGIRGTIAELASVEKKYQTAMEVAAAGKMQAVVVDTDEDAARAIDLLKRNKLGRATFLPLNKMVPGRPGGKPLLAARNPDAEGFAIDLVEFDEEYRNAFWYVFRDTIIAKSLDAARRMMGGVRLVTMDGDLIDAGGAMTGGDRDSAKGSQVRFGANEAAQFEKVRKELHGAIAHQEALSADLSEIRAEIDALEARLRDATSSTTQRSTKLSAFTARKAEVEARLATIQTLWGEAKRDLLAVDAELQDREREIARLGKQLGSMETKREDLGSLLTSATPKELAREQEVEERAAAKLRETVRDLTSQLATKEHSLQLLEERKAEILQRLAEADAKLTTEEQNVATYTELSAKKEQELAVLLAIDNEHSEAVRGLNAERETLMKAKNELAMSAERARVARNAKDDILLSYRGRIPVIEGQIAEFREELRQFSHVPQDVAESVEDLRSKVGRLERQLEALGNVNMLALDEYERQAARKNELESEVERLHVERDHLIALVTEIVAKKKEGFFKVYDEINVNFSKVYERLSNGGKAELMLENAEDPFAGGLTMKAQPKGKKVTRLEALSGGEKSLTSMAFIFAIQEFDPSPFYYLDEVDQNLDGINSELLAKMVKDESKHAQFIIVSLRKITLKEADHVYGVTMMDNGLSEIVGEVRIAELADEPPPTEVAP